uniref:Uncharacterized protein n=1 Tax=Mycena chlorophos TaxID=658473 RepID=A0ABQ0KV89_MYCCL|nr:predicted protein [Mycena chlorophos]
MENLGRRQPQGGLEETQDAPWPFPLLKEVHTGVGTERRGRRAGGGCPKEGDAASRTRGQAGFDLLLDDLYELLSDSLTRTRLIAYPVQAQIRISARFLLVTLQEATIAVCTLFWPSRNSKL